MTFCNKCKKEKNFTEFINCKHKICRNCVKIWCEGNNDFSHCLIDNCKSAIFDFEIRQILDETDYKKFEKKLCSYDTKKHPRAEWVCTSCTYINLPYIKFCVVCQSDRDDKYTVPDYYKPTEQEVEAIKLEENDKKNEQERLKKEEKERELTLARLKELTQEEVAMTHEVSECPVCMLEYPPGKAIILHSCLHTICRDCLKNYLLNTVHPKIKCPTDNCIGQLEDKEISKMLSKSEYENYQQLSLRTAEATETLSFHCKAVNCTAWIVHDELLDNFKCPMCKKENCIKCKAIHEGVTCYDYKIKQSQTGKTEDSVYFENLLKNGEAMLCSGCKCLIEKVQGCDWIRCKMCQTELCWATKGARWGPKGHGDISGGCRCRINGIKCHPSCHYCH